MESVVVRLWQAAAQDLERTQRGIIVLDEVGFPSFYFGFFVLSYLILIYFILFYFSLFYFILF